jgi:hypothetical protein
MKASKTASATGLKGELAWLPLTCEVDVRRMCLWAKLQLMGENRLPKRIYQMMEQSHPTGSWATEAKKLARKYDIEGIVKLEKKNWRKAIRGTMEKVAWREWLESTESNPRLECYSTEKLGKRSQYLDREGQSEWLCKGRINDVYAIAGQADMKVCPICGGRIRKVVEHILLECNATPHTHEWVVWIRDLKSFCPEGDRLTALVLNTSRHDIQDEIGRLIELWVKKRLQKEKARSDG